ncbi:hypothetical protein AGMMS49942_02600 [Spirochaetia bacterium]|nr:hypothetical protein AGMMS49942_02600 [Spirochaetia bacterium]
MKYVYVLTSSEKDLYYEQFFLSVTSLRLYNPEADIIVLLDEKTKAGLTGKRAGYEQIVSEIKIIPAPEEYSQKEASRWIKTSIRKHITGDFLFIDCDTIITSKLEPNFPPELKVGAVLDSHVGLSEHHLRYYFQQSDRQVGFVSSFNHENHFNGGLLFCRDAPEGEQFFDKWHSLWLVGRRKGNVMDMPSMNQANYELNDIIIELGGAWNCQISHNGLPYLYDAKIIHYYATSLDFITSSFLPGSNSTLSSIKETGVISAEILLLLEHPKAAFEKHLRIIADKEVIDAFDSSLFAILRWLRKKNPSLFTKLDRLMFRFTKFIKRLINS